VHLYFIPTLPFLQVTTLSIYLLANNKLRSKFLLFGLGFLMLVTIYFLVGVRHKCFGFASPGSLIFIVIYILAAFFIYDEKSISEIKKKLLFIWRHCIISNRYYMQFLRIFAFIGQLFYAITVRGRQYTFN
jgi:hypothetical protein